MKNNTPAVLLYPGDFISDTVHLTNEQFGQYTKLLMHQNLKGHMSLEFMESVLGEKVHPLVLDFFVADEDGNYYNKRMEEEIERRNKFQESRCSNGKKGGRPKASENHMVSDRLSKTKPTENLTETETETEIETVNNTKDEQQKQTAKVVIEHLNEVTGSHYQVSKESLKHLKARLNEGKYNLNDFIAVIDKKADQWLTDPKMAQYLRPRTLFGPKFEEYLHEPIPKRGSGNEFLDLLNEMGDSRT